MFRKWTISTFMRSIAPRSVGKGYAVHEEPPQWRGLYRVILTLLSCAAIVLLVATVSTFKVEPTPAAASPVVYRETVMVPYPVTETPIPTPTLSGTGIAWRATIAAIPTPTFRPYETRTPTPNPTSALGVPMEGTEAVGDIPTPEIPWCLMAGCWYE